MKIISPRLLLLCSALATANGALAEELSPPDVDFFAEIKAGKALVESFDVDNSDGFKISAGLWMNELLSDRPARLGLELGYLALADSSDELQSSREPRLPSENTANFEPQRVDENNRRSVKITGFTLGGIWDTGSGIELRGGGYVYNFKETDRIQRTLVGSNDGEVLVVNDAPQSNSENGVAPYFGAGAAIPLGERFNLLIDTTLYFIESETVQSLSIGLRFN